MKRFLKPVKIDALEREVFFWGCLHLNHDPKWDTPIWNLRGFNSVTDFNTAVIKNWNSKIKSDSIVFLLGDTVFGYNAEEYILNFFNQVQFKECYLMGGNHTAGWKQLLDKTNEDGEYVLYDSKKLILIPNYLEIIINGHPLVLSHYPIVSWNGQNKGAIMLHAHVHGNLEKSEIGKLLYKSKIKEVSFEKTHYPLSFNEIKNELNKAPITFDHH